MRLRTLLTLGALGAGGTWLTQRHREIQRASPDLRTPLLYLAPFRAVVGETTLKRRRAKPQATEPIPGTTVIRESVGNTEVVIFDRAERVGPTGAVLWIHGGGRIVGAPEENAEWNSVMAQLLGVPVVSVRYRLAPENPYPAGLDDCMAALHWLHDNAERLGVDAGRLAVAGASAGAGLAAEVAQRALDEGGPAIAFQALMFPMLDDRTTLRENPNRRGTLAWSERSNKYAWDAYLGHPVRADVLDPYVAAARRKDLSGLPPAWIGVGDLDLFYDEDLDYARRLNEAGVECELHTVPGMYHAANALCADASAMVEFNMGLVEALRRAIG